MDQLVVVPQVHSTEHSTEHHHLVEPIAESGSWSVFHMNLTIEKTEAIWSMLQRYKTLFSDMTRDDAELFFKRITSPKNMWFEVVEHGTVIGLIYFESLDMTDCLGHMVFFDRRPAEKIHICKAVVKWMFDQFPLHRMTVTPPSIYHATIRLLQHMGFKYEGTQREKVLLGGKWVGQELYGITRTEVRRML